MAKRIVARESSKKEPFRGIAAVDVSHTVEQHPV